MKAKVGVYVCECGPNISEKIDIDRILEALPGLEEYRDIELVVKRFGLLCSGDGKTFLEDEINNNGLTHLVLGACSPRDHDKTFIAVCKKTSLNPFLYKIINIREHCAWIIPDKDQATDKAITYMRAGINRVLFQSALMEKKLDINPDVIIVGGGIAGIEASLSLAAKDRMVYLVEKDDHLGGKAVLFGGLLPRQGGGSAKIREKIESVLGNDRIKVYLESELKNVIGFLGNFEVMVAGGEGGEERELKVGAIIVATGSGMSDPSALDGLKYSEADEVITSMDAERMFAKDGKISLKSGGEPKSVALIHCVGREEKGYCSRICCNYMMKIAGYLKDQSADMRVIEFHRGLCLPDKADQGFQKETEGRGVEFKRVRELTIAGTKVNAEGMDGKSEALDFDLVILAPALEPSEGTEGMAELLGVPLSESGYYQEIHQTTNPVATSIEGVFVVGAAHSPKGITDSMLFAQASAGKILSQLIPGGKITPEIKVSEILEAYCTGCGNCLDVCVYGAIYYDEGRGISVVNEAVCRGCGNCFGSCPSGALRTKHFTNTQLYEEMREAIR
ncbi:MAG: FAD-dependent oxidoreductase [Bacteroidales bacterium]|nr:FAD-dependent oxidoreductase [Candidatus Latescibacterota bacterium]